MSLAFAFPLVLLTVRRCWADRHDRRKTMLAMDAVSGLVSLVLVLLIIAHVLALWMLLVLLTLIATAGVFHFAAFDTGYVMLVPPRQLLRANGMIRVCHRAGGHHRAGPRRQYHCAAGIGARARGSRARPALAGGIARWPRAADRAGCHQLFHFLRYLALPHDPLPPAG